MDSIRLHREYGLNPTIPVCFFCGKNRDEVALLGAAFKGRAPTHMIVDKEPCDECKRSTQIGILFIEVKEGCKNPEDPESRTGKLFVVKEEAAFKIFDKYEIGKGRIVFISDAAAEKFGLHGVAPSYISLEDYEAAAKVAP